MIIRIWKGFIAAARPALAMAGAGGPGAAETLLGEGMARAFVELDAGARPTAIGLVMSERKIRSGPPQGIGGHDPARPPMPLRPWSHPKPSIPAPIR